MEGIREFYNCQETGILTCCEARLYLKLGSGRCWSPHWMWQSFSSLREGITADLCSTPLREFPSREVHCFSASLCKEHMPAEIPLHSRKRRSSHQNSFKRYIWEGRIQGSGCSVSVEVSCQLNRHRAYIEFLRGRVFQEDIQIENWWDFGSPWA